MDAMEQSRACATLEEAEQYVEVMYNAGFTAYVLPVGSAYEVRWSEYE